MKNLFFLFLLLAAFLISGCTNQKESTSITPYQLTKQEETLINLSPIQQGNIFIYEASLPNKEDEIRTTLEYYKNGKKVKDIGGFSLSHFEENSIKLSFGQQTFQYENGTREVQQWFMNIAGSSYRSFEDTFPGRNVSTFVSISKEKKIQYNEKIIIGAWISNTNKIETSSTSLEDDHAIQHLLQKNEHVYTFCIEIKSSDVTK